MSNEQEKKTCFVIGPIGSAGSQTRIDADFLLDGIIREVLEKEPFNYNVKRADKDVSPGSINSAVINDIIHADLAIADLSEHNPNAFYELGIRHAFNKPVIHIIREGEQIPFDNLDQRCISFSTGSWEGILTARERLKDCVNYVHSSDYKPSNPVGIAESLQSMADSGNEIGVWVRSLMDRVSSLERERERERARENNVRRRSTRNKVYEIFKETASRATDSENELSKSSITSLINDI